MSSASVELKKAVRSLPRASREVATMLQMRQVTGVRNSLKLCPLAKHLSTATQAEVCVAMGGAWIFRVQSWTELGRGAKDFINDFDRGLYPFLVEKGAGQE